MAYRDISGKEYKEHIIFDELEQYSKFYDSLSFSVFGFLSMGIKGGIVNYESYLLSSIKGTIESIKILLANGGINDAYALARKYYDSVVINIYTSLYLEDHFSLENFIVLKINNWLNGTEKLPTYKEMNKYLKEHIKLHNVNNLLLKDKHYTNLRQRLNDHTHYNYFQHVMLNDNEIYNPNRIKALDQLSNDIRDIFIKHFIWLFTIKEHYMMSSDYIDYLDCNEIPPGDSQYYVANFVQEIFNRVIKVYREDLAIELKSLTCMDLQ